MAIEVEDICVGKEEMEDKEEECYLGDIISKDGKNIKTSRGESLKGRELSKEFVIFCRTFRLENYSFK